MIRFIFRTMRLGLGFLFMLTGAVIITYSFLIGFILIALGYFMFNGYEQVKAYNVKAKVKEKLGEDTLELLVASYEDNPYKNGFLILTNTHIAYVKGSKFFAFNHKEITRIALDSQGTGSFIGGTQRVGNLSINSAREVSERVIRIAGISNGKAYQHTWASKEKLWPGKKANNFYKSMTKLDIYKNMMDENPDLDLHQI